VDLTRFPLRQELTVSRVFVCYLVEKRKLAVSVFYTHDIHNNFRIESDTDYPLVSLLGD
jgi:hypothetical protein